MDLRKERDFLGEVEIPAEALSGIHTARALDNFPATNRFNLNWYQSAGLVKKACYQTILAFKKAAKARHSESSIIKQIPEDKLLAPRGW